MSRHSESKVSWESIGEKKTEREEASVCANMCVRASSLETAREERFVLVGATLAQE